jgi:hypothetical protein
MRYLIMALSAAALLSSCSGSDDNQSDPVNNTPAVQPGNATPADRSATPQTGTGGQSPAQTPAGNTNNSPAGAAKP